LFPHDGNTLAHVVCTVAVYFGAKSVRVSNPLYFFQLACEVVVLCLYVCETVDPGNDLCSVFSKSVQDNTERFLAHFVCFLSDTDRTLCCCEGLMSSQEAEAVCCLLKEHLAKVTMSKTYFTLISNGSRNTESLQALSDGCCGVCSCLTALLDGDSCTCDVSPACILETDRLNAFDLVVYVQSGIFCDLL